MKKDTHPKWYPDAVVSCTCGNTFTVGSTLSTIQAQICNKCHPYFTGEMRYIDTLGRVDKFKKKRDHAKKIETQRLKQAKRQEKETAKKEREPKTLKEMLQAIR